MTNAPGCPGIDPSGWPLILALYFANSKVKQFSKHFDWNNIFTAILTNGSIGKGIGDTGKGIKKNAIFTICNLLYDGKKYLDLFKA